MGNRSERNRRRRWLSPLCYLPYYQIDDVLRKMTRGELKALASAMDTCTSTNCWWAEADLARRYRDDVRRLIESRSKTKRVAR